MSSSTISNTPVTDDITSALKGINVVGWVTAVVTALGAYSIFPAPVGWVQKLGQNKVIQYLFLLGLVYQGGGSQNILFSIVVSGIVYLLMEATRSFITCSEDTGGISCS